jgi:hypothetical protein
VFLGVSFTKLGFKLSDSAGLLQTGVFQEVDSLFELLLPQLA